MERRKLAKDSKGREITFEASTEKFYINNITYRSTVDHIHHLDLEGELTWYTPLAQEWFYTRLESMLDHESRGLPGRVSTGRAGKIEALLKVIVALICLVIGLKACSPGSSSTPPPPKRAVVEEPVQETPVADIRAMPHIGETGLLTADCYGSIDDEWSSLTEAIRADDQVGVRELIDSGQIWLLTEGDTVKVLDGALTTMKVRFVGGKYAGKVCWVEARFVGPAQ